MTAVSLNEREVERLWALIDRQPRTHVDSIVPPKKPTKFELPGYARALKALKRRSEMP